MTTARQVFMKGWDVVGGAFIKALLERTEGYFVRNFYQSQNANEENAWF